MALIHILDKVTDEILETLDSNKKEFTEAIKIDNLNLKETFDFKAISTIEKSSLLQKRNRIVVKDEDGFFREYIISEVDEYRRGQKDVYSDASYIDLKKAKVIEPQALEGQTPATAVEFALSGTEWKAGEIEFVNIRSIAIDDYTNPYDLLKKIASTFDLEIRFRVEIKGGRIVGRYVDMVKQRAGFEGKEIEFGKDLIGVKRTENSANIVTALFGVGPEKEDGTRLTILVANEEALQRWGRNGKHLIDVYEPQSDNMDMTLERLKLLTEAELKKRIDASVIYEVEAVGIENVKGLEHEKIRTGQVVRIKDTSYYPPLYLEARIQESGFDPILKKVKRFKIGEFIEFKKEDLEAKIKVLKELLKLKASSAEVVQVKTYAEQQAQQAKQEAITQAEFDSSSKMEVAKVYAVEQAKQAETNVKTYVRDYSISKELFNQTYEQMTQEIADKAGLEYVDGQLVSKADKDGVYTKTEVENALNSKVSTTTYTTDKNGIVTRLDSAESRIEQTELGLSSKVSNTVYEAGMQSLKDYVDIEDFGSSYKVFNNVHGNTFSVVTGSLVIETSIPWKSGTMCSIYIKGYNYLENNNDIDLNIGFYTYADGVFHNKGYTNKGTMQITEVRIGVTSSNKIVLILNPINFVWRYPKFIVDKFIAGYATVPNGINKNWTSKIKTDLSAYTNVVSLSSTVNLPVMSNRLSKAETDIVQTAEQVALKASKTELDSAKQDISKAQAQLTVQAGQIATKVEKNGVISAVNQTAEAYKIQASKLDLQGYATFSDLSTPGKTTISGSNVRTGTITVGGNANGNGQLEVVDANNGLIFRANQNGIVDTKGRELIGKGGVLSSFVFLGNTDYYGWQQVGWHGASVGFNVKSPVTFQIPQNFVITKAELRLESIPIYEFEDGVEKRGPLHCDSLKLYKVGDWSDSFFMTDWFEIYGETPRTSTHTDVTSQTFGRDTLNPSQEVNPHRIKGFTANIKNYVSSGVNKFYVGSSKAYNEAMSYGAIRLTVFVEGYIN